MFDRMSNIWVDTDFGFDDLWAILLLRRNGIRIAGISLTFGNATLHQAVANALGARAAYSLSEPLFAGAERPMVRSLETAERILGAPGMRSRGEVLPVPSSVPVLPSATDGMSAWLRVAQEPAILAIGPLTNIAQLLRQAPEAAQKIARIVWMGGSNGPGNHSAAAEFNCLADPEAAEAVAGSGIPLDVVDLELCRQVTFGSEDMPEMTRLSADLLGGYLDIALERGRSSMSVYDPVAACAIASLVPISFQPMALEICTADGPDYGATRFFCDESSTIRLATACPPETKTVCLAALAQDHAHVP